VPVHSPALQEALRRAARQAFDNDSILVESPFLLVALAENPTSEAGFVLNTLGFDPAEGWLRLMGDWRAPYGPTTGPSELVTHVLRQAQWRARFRGQTVVTTGMVLLAFCRRRTGDVSLLEAAGLNRRRTRQAVRSERRTRRLVRWPVETASDGVTRKANNWDRLNWTVYPPSRFPLVRRWFLYRFRHQEVYSVVDDEAGAVTS
jgi:ATP-dependent Clp protease ATP-binding subunit ClpA